MISSLLLCAVHVFCFTGLLHGVHRILVAFGFGGVKLGGGALGLLMLPRSCACPYPEVRSKGLDSLDAGSGADGH